METLIIILIVALIAQTCLFAYSHFFDINSNKSTAATIELMDTAVKQYAENITALQKGIAIRDENYAKLCEKYDEVVKLQNLTVKYLPSAVEKEAMRKIIEGENLSENINVLAEYYNWVKTIKYSDNEEKPSETKEN